MQAQVVRGRPIQNGLIDFFPPAIVNSQIAQVDRPKVLEQSEKFLDLGTVTRPPSSIYARVNCSVIRDWCTRVQGSSAKLVSTTMEFRAFVAKAPHLTIPRQRTLVYGGKLIFSNAAAKLPKAISQKRHDGFSFLNDGNLDKCLSKKQIRLATPALWLSSPHWAKCMTKSKFLETACKNNCTHTSAPRHVRVPRSRNFSDCWANGLRFKSAPLWSLCSFFSLSNWGLRKILSLSEVK